jgi:hypothetical protein
MWMRFMKIGHLATCVGLILVATAPVTAQAAGDKRPDPLQNLTKAFPKSVELRNNGRLLEFCPDGTCDGFETSGNVSAATLRDFAYLYVYFFSDYTFLGDWRDSEEAKKTAERVLAQPEYLTCKNADRRGTARCVLRQLSRNGRIRLIFVRYDEGQRNVVRENIAEELSEKSTAPKP